MSTPSQALQPQQPRQPQRVLADGAEATQAELHRFNEDAAAARHLTAIRIRGQLADIDGEPATG